MGCPPSPTVPSSLFASSPFLTEKEERLQGRTTAEETDSVRHQKRSGRAGTRAGRGGGRARGAPEKHGLAALAVSSAVAVQGWRSGVGGQHTGVLPGGESHSFSALTLSLGFHLEDGIFKIVIWKRRTQRS